MVIWILDCSNGCVTKVNLSKEREKEFEQTDDAYDFICKYADEFGINSNWSSYMVSDNDNVYDVNF